MTADDSALRRALDAALAELEASGQVLLRADRTDVVDFLCQGVAGAMPAADDDGTGGEGTRATFVAALDAAARDGFAHPAWRRAATRRYTDATVEEARRQAGLVQLRLAQEGVTAAQAAVYLRRLADGLREDQREGDGAG